ncbi:hypothetical protein HWV62_14274 [Athelia sp. TMB]|nr:hypothetical protein HWV62_14274 [Athelia sp. TMB]
MRHINGERRRRILSLSKRLQEFAAARIKLIAQLEDLDSQTRAVQQEHNALHNLDAPTSNLPNEILSLVFEAGIGQESYAESHFGDLVSHVSSRWRAVALTTPRLWADIRTIHAREGWCFSIAGGHSPNWVGKLGWKERITVHLSRSRSLPVTIHLKGLREEDFTHDFLELIGSHAGRFRRVIIEDIPHHVVPTLLQHIQSQPVSLLTSFCLVPDDNNDDDDEVVGLQLQEQLFPYGAPRLTIAELGGIHTDTLHYLLPSFASITSLRLTNVILLAHKAYEVLRHALVELKLLNHLEITLLDFEILDFPSPLLPISLPTIQILGIGALKHTSIVDNFLDLIQAPAMATLFLDGWHCEEGESEQAVFPALQHLVLANISKSTTGGGLDELSCKLAENLGIKRLTFRASVGDEQWDIEAILAGFYWGTNNELREDLPDAEDWLRWPSITTIATTSYSVPWHAESALPTLLCKLRNCGNKIRTLLLPRRFIAETGVNTIAKMKKYVKIEEFCDDFPRPFDRSGGKSLAPARLNHTDC